MKKWFYKSMIISGLVITSFPSTFAITDVTGMLIYARQLQQIRSEIAQADRTIKQLREEYEELNKIQKTAEKLAEDNEGHSGFGGLFNTDSDVSQRKWSPDSWEDTLRGLSGGNSERYKQLQEIYKKDHPTLSFETYTKRTNPEMGRIYKSQIQTNQAASVSASFAFNDINKHIQTVYQLSQQIEEAKNTKAAMDLNSRLLAEMAYIQIQELKMQAILNQQIAQQSSDYISGESQEANFNRLPDE